MQNQTLVWAKSCGTYNSLRIWRYIRLDSHRDNGYYSSVPSIREEIKQAKDFPSLEAEAALALLRTADVLQAKVAELLKPYGLSPTQYNALRILRGAGAEGLPCSEIADRMINRDPDITRLLDRLERQGLTSRSRNQKDRRVINARISAAGLKRIQPMDAPLEEFQKQLLGEMGEQRLRTLIRLLDTLRGSLNSKTSTK